MDSDEKFFNSDKRLVCWTCNIAKVILSGQIACFLPIPSRRIYKHLWNISKIQVICGIILHENHSRTWTKWFLHIWIERDGEEWKRHGDETEGWSIEIKMYQFWEIQSLSVCHVCWISKYLQDSKDLSQVSIRVDYSNLHSAHKRAATIADINNLNFCLDCYIDYKWASRSCFGISLINSPGTDLECTVQLTWHDLQLTFTNRTIIRLSNKELDFSE